MALMETHGTRLHCWRKGVLKLIYLDALFLEKEIKHWVRIYFGQIRQKTELECNYTLEQEY